MTRGIYIRTKPGYWKGKKRPNISAAQKGKTFSPETIQKMREAKLRNPVRYWAGKKRPEVLSWILPANVGRPSSRKGLKLPHLSGSNNYRWIADRTKLIQSEKKHLDSRYREWMRAVKNRDGWKCRISNDDCSGRLEAHHILRWKDHPELRYELTNGITLCAFHHPKKKDDEMRLSPYFTELVMGKAH